MNVNIYQIYFHDDQIQYLEPSFQHYKNLFNFNRLYEQNVIESSLQIAAPDTDVWGFTSWKFRYKTNMTGEDWINFIKSNPNVDAWYMEPISVPSNPYVNPWAHGEAHHPGMMVRSEKILQRLGYKLNPRTQPLPLCFFSYYAMRRELWQKYIATIQEIKHIIETDPVLKQEMFMDNVQYGVQEIPFYTFFAERFITTFLHENGIASVAMPFHNQWFVYKTD